MLGSARAGLKLSGRVIILEEFQPWQPVITIPEHHTQTDRQTDLRTHGRTTAGIAEFSAFPALNWFLVTDLGLEDLWPWP